MLNSKPNQTEKLKRFSKNIVKYLKYKTRRNSPRSNRSQSALINAQQSAIFIIGNNFNASYIALY